MSPFRYYPPEVLKLTGTYEMQHYAVQRLVRPWEVEHLITRNVSSWQAAQLPPLSEQVAQYLRDSFANGQLAYKSDPGGFLDYWSSPGATLQRGTGDCEDFSLIAVSLLAAVGIHADLVVGTYRKGFSKFGHAWVEGRDANSGFLIEGTTGDIHRIYRPNEYEVLWSIAPQLAQRAA